MKEIKKIDLSGLDCREAEVRDASLDHCVVSLHACGGGIGIREALEGWGRYIIGDVEVLADHSVAMLLRAFTKEAVEERFFLRFGLLPRVRTRICLDLELLDIHTIFTRRTPGTLKLVAQGQRTQRADVTRFELGMKDCFEDVELRLENFYLSDREPETYLSSDEILVDRFGQWNRTDWPGKIHSEDELASRFLAGETEVNWPYPEWDPWGGDTRRHLADGTGYFATVKTEDGRWHLVDPDGNEFFSVGTCCVHPGDFGRVDGFEKNCAWLPDEKDPLYEECMQTGHRSFPDGSEENYRMFSFALANLKRVYKEDWEAHWRKMTRHTLRRAGLNTQGNWSSDLLNKDREKVPYVQNLNGFPTTQIRIFRDFPDVLSPEYAASAEMFAKSLEPFKNDPYMIGYFLRNEPEFNFVENLKVVDEVLRNPADTYCRRGFLAAMETKYGSIDALNDAWKSHFADFSALLLPIACLSAEVPGAEEDIRAYSRFLIREYTRIPSEACRKVDSRHMNLGMRWSMVGNPDMLTGWEYFDVFSMNCYAFDPTPAMDYVENAGVDRPIMIGEFHSGSLDRGLPATGLKGVRNQEERGKMVRYYFERVASHPYGVGAHWFQFADQFCLGRFDGENYQIGLVDVCSQPYAETMQAMQDCGRVIYAVKNGEQEPFDVLPESIPMIGY